MRSRRGVLCYAVVAALGVAAGDAAEDRLRIDVTPHFSTAPAVVRVRAVVPPDDENRSLLFVADGGRYYRSSLIPLDGAHAAAVTELTLKNLPAGEYDVTVILTDAEGRETTRSTEVVVTGSF